MVKSREHGYYRHKVISTSIVAYQYHMFKATQTSKPIMYKSSYHDITQEPYSQPLPKPTSAMPM